MTKSGDSGETSLFAGGRVKKSDLRLWCYGTFDEAQSMLGLARALSNISYVKHQILWIQMMFFVVNWELATALDKLESVRQRITQESVAELESRANALEAKVELEPKFVVPGDTAASGALDVARAVIRRGERFVVTLNEMGQLANPALLQFINRLSDFVYLLARAQERCEAGQLDAASLPPGAEM
jgi:cob(I)alamin adenosyltransferase